MSVAGPFSLEHGTCTSQLRYEYCGATLGRLREQVALPHRLQAAVLSRQVDFLAGRVCARQALRAAGFPGDAEVAIGSRGEPVWPARFVGSISHSDGVAVACVAEADCISALGIDVERRMRPGIAAEVRTQLATDEELALWRSSGMSQEDWLATLFSGKESLFKALYPGVGRHFDFRDANAIGLDADAGRFTLRLQCTLSPRHLRGATYPIHFHWDAGRVFTRCLVARQKIKGET